MALVLCNPGTILKKPCLSFYFQSCFAMFRSLSTLEKTVDKCKIKLDEKEARLVFQMYCRHGKLLIRVLTCLGMSGIQSRPR